MRVIDRCAMVELVVIALLLCAQGCGNKATGGGSLDEAEAANRLGKAQEGWFAALAGCDEEMLGKYAAAELSAAKQKAAQAESQAAGGKTEAAVSLYDEAVAALKNAQGDALTKRNAAKAEPIIKRLEAAVRKRDKFAAEDLLAEVEKLIPKDSRVASLRQSVEAVPDPKKPVTLDLGGGAKMELVLIRPGSFMMGDANGFTDEKPAHKVTITQPFYIGKYEVTQKQWEAVMGNNPSHFKGPQNPVEEVSWEDCRAFLRKLNDKFAASGAKFSLPTEAQWEYACRAGGTGEFCYGDDKGTLGEYAWFKGNSGHKTHLVGEKKPNAWGLYDMHGNVWEWCADWYDADYYGQSPVNGPAGPSSGSYRVGRGGSWLYVAPGCRAATRLFNAPTYRYRSAGLRVVCVR